MGIRGWSLTAWALIELLTLGSASAGATYQATITRTRYGIPHVVAPNWSGLGFGTAYGFAEDNFCLLADQLVTLAGQRAKYFAADGSVIVAFRPVHNVESDTYFRGTFDDTALISAAHLTSRNYQDLLQRGTWKATTTISGRREPSGCQKPAVTPPGSDR